MSWSDSFNHLPLRNEEDEECLICCKESVYTAISPADALVLDQLFQFRSSTPVSQIFRSAPCCPSCFSSIQDIGKILYDLRYLESKLEEWKDRIETQLKNSYDRIKLKAENGSRRLQSGIQNIPLLPFRNNQRVREQLVTHFQEFPSTWSRIQCSVRDFATSKNGACDRNQTNEVITGDILLPDFQNDQFEQDHDDAPPSPAVSFRSSHSLEEKFVPPIDAEVKFDQNFTTSITTEAFQGNTVEKLTSIRKRNKKGASKRKSRLFANKHSTRKPCPFQPSCGIVLSRCDEISIEAHRLRHHEGVRNCYVCKTCGAGFSGYNGFVEHQELYHNSEAKTNIQGEVHLSTTNETDIPSTHFSRIADSRYPIVMLNQMQPEEDGGLLTKSNSEEDGSHRRNSSKIRSEDESGSSGRHQTDREAGENNSNAQNESLDVEAEEEDTPSKSQRTFPGIFQVSKIQSTKPKSKRHTGNQDFVCSYCQMKFRNYKLRLFHIREVHEREKMKHRCDECDQAFVTKAKYDTHMRIHTKARPFMCELCSETFTSRQYLRYHMSKHDGSGFAPIKCNLCDKQFSAPTYLSSHIKRVHTRELRFKCDLCDFQVLNKSELQIHVMRKHSEERNFKCTMCPASFKLKPGLVHHMKSHTGERNFKCSTCGKAFVYKDGLDRHELIHSNAQTHMCQICGKTFPVRNYLYIHMRSHNKTNGKRKTTNTNINNTIPSDPILTHTETLEPGIAEVLRRTDFPTAISE